MQAVRSNFAVWTDCLQWRGQPVRTGHTGWRQTADQSGMKYLWLRIDETWLSQPYHMRHASMFMQFRAVAIRFSSSPRIPSPPTHIGGSNLLRHRWDDAVAAYDIRTHLDLKLDLLCDAAGLDNERARVVSELRVLNTAVGDLQRDAPHLTELLTRAVTIIKALQPA